MRILREAADLPSRLVPDLPKTVLESLPPGVHSFSSALASLNQICNCAILGEVSNGVGGVNDVIGEEVLETTGLFDDVVKHLILPDRVLLTLVYLHVLARGDIPNWLLGKLYVSILLLGT